MLPERYRRLLGRRLRRRPLLPFLLAATVAVDLALAASAYDAPITDPLGIGFLSAQIGLLAIWATASARWIYPRLLAAIAGTGLIGVASGMHSISSSELRASAAALTVLLVANLAAAGAVRALAGWIRGARLHRSRTRFKVHHLLSAMLLTAVAALLFRGGDWSVLLDSNVLWRLVGYPVPTAVMLGLAVASPAGWRRAALLVAIPFAAAAFGLSLHARGVIDSVGAYFPVEALFLGVWLYAVGPDFTCVRRVRRAANDRPNAVEDPERDPDHDPGPATIAMRFDAVV